MHSAVTGRTYRISVYTPPGPAPKAGLPLLLTTDADVFFPLAVGQMLIRAQNEIRPALVVGVSYPTIDVPTVTRLRFRDLTPVVPGVPPPGLSAIGVTAADMGGAELFYRFIVEELQPMLAARYPLDSRERTLFGHSLGGLFTLHVLFNHPSSFQTYIAASPSILWSDRAIMTDIPGFESKVAAANLHPRLLLTVGGDEANVDSLPLGPAPRADMEKVMVEGRALANVADLAAVLARIPGVEIRTQVFPNENHVSVQPASLARGLTFALARPTYGDPCPWPCKPPTAAPK